MFLENAPSIEKVKSSKPEKTENEKTKYMNIT